MNFTDAHSHFTFGETLTIVQSDDKAAFRSEGVHPVIDSQQAGEKLRLVEKLAANKQIVAVGECGLDKNSTLSTEEQLGIFKKQVHIAANHSLPVIVHCVSRWNELGLIIREFPEQVFVIHGFRKMKLAETLLRDNTFLSFGQALLYDEHLQEGIKAVPIDKILLETDDAVFDIKESYEKLAQLFSTDLQTVTSTVEANFHRVFPDVRRKEAGK